MNAFIGQVEPLWTVDDVAAYLSVPKATLYQWRTKDYGPPGFIAGRHLRYEPAQVRAWVAARKDAA